MAPPPTSSIGRPHVDHDDHRPTFKEIGAEERAAVREFIERHNAVALTAKARAAQLMKIIADLASEGKLQTAYRSLAGGSFNPIPKDWWNTERLDARFACCVVNPDRPFERGGTAYIFVSRTDLERIVLTPTASLHPPKVLTPEGEYTHPKGPGRPGRKKGEGSWEHADRKLFPKMAQLIKDGEAASPQQAASILTKEIQGMGTPQNRVERVARRYRKEYRSN